MKILRKEDLTHIGLVNKVSGFNGNLSCTIVIARPEKLLKNKFFFLILEGLPVPFAVEKMEMKGEELIVKFADVDSEQAAKKLLRKEIFVEKMQGKKKNDLLNWKDLVNYTAIDNNNGEIGIIKEVLDYPMQMIARCMDNDNEILFPLNDDIVLEIDDTEKKIFINLPDGLLDIYRKPTA